MTIREFTEVYDGYFEGNKISHKAYCNCNYDSVIENYLDKKVINIYHRDYDGTLIVMFED